MHVCIPAPPTPHTAGLPHRATTSPRNNPTVQQITRNNLMRPILEPVLAKYKREHSTDTAVIDLYHDDGNSSDDDDVPRGPLHLLSTAVQRTPPTSDRFVRNVCADSTARV